MTSAEFALMSGFIALTYFLYKYSDEDFFGGDEKVRKFYLGASHLFLLGVVFSGARIAGKNGYGGIETALNSALMGVGLIFSVVGGFFFIQIILEVGKEAFGRGYSD